MECVTINDNCVCGEELRKVINNMLKLQKHIDNLSISPGFKKEKWHETNKTTNKF